MMTEAEAVKKIGNIFSDIMDVSPDLVKIDTLMEEIPEWDSLGHIRLIMSVEEEFSVKFPITEIPKFKSINALVEGILKQTNK